MKGDGNEQIRPPPGNLLPESFAHFFCIKMGKSTLIVILELIDRTRAPAFCEARDLLPDQKNGGPPCSPGSIPVPENGPALPHCIHRGSRMTSRSRALRHAGQMPCRLAFPQNGQISGHRSAARKAAAFPEISAT